MEIASIPTAFDLEWLIADGTSIEVATSSAVFCCFEKLVNFIKSLSGCIASKCYAIYYQEFSWYLCLTFRLCVTFTFAFEVLKWWLESFDFFFAFTYCHLVNSPWADSPFEKGFDCFLTKLLFWMDSKLYSEVDRLALRIIRFFLSS